MEFNCPDNHKHIVEDLMDGKFILSKAKYYDSLKEDVEYYELFFKKSFGHTLIFNQEFSYLISSETNENLSRDINIFIAILCYELDKQGRNFLDFLEYGDFSLEEIDELFENSTYSDLIQSHNQIKDGDARRKLIRAMINKNILEKISGDRLAFTPAHKVFIDFAKELAENKMKESNSDSK